jgi:hypothetical protein
MARDVRADLQFNNPELGPKEDIADGRLTGQKLSVLIIDFEDMYGTVPMPGEFWLILPTLCRF